MNYEIWDVETGNCVGRFDDEAAALNWVRSLLERFGAGYADSLVVGVENPSGDDSGSWSGEELRSRLATTSSRNASAAD